ncbi:hypothetical protein HD554DRAFT_2309665 [Boletus coccyginus]|nr:hypothetical protein HD554DRAFT_2309665 [Boletus coccyginus]
MHRALYLEEILRNIFSYIPFVIPLPGPPLTPVRGRFRSQSDMLSLATTCKAFKEPALDMLWASLQDLSPLIRCLPEQSWIISQHVYSLNRRLEQADWDIILGYARRVQSLSGLRGLCGLAVDCLEELSRPPSSTVSIFPKLRDVWLTSPSKGISCFVRQLSSPRLTKLFLSHTEKLGNAIDAFGEGCPNVLSFTVQGWANPDTISTFFCHWPNLYSVYCMQADLNVAALSHLSRLRNLRYLHCRLHEEVADLIQSSQSVTSTLTFSTLQTLSMASRSLASDWGFLHHFRLPVISELAVSPRVTPTMPELISFFAVLPESCAHDTLCGLNFILEDSFDFESSSSVSEIDEDFPPYYITFDHLRPLTVFANIRILCIRVDLYCGVDLNERELLCLASSWPRLISLSVSSRQHWPASSGITPGGFVQLLDRCRSLKCLNIVFDTRGYTEIPQGHPWSGLAMPKGASLHLQTSRIEEESINALAVFFHVAPFPDFRLNTYWNEPEFLNSRISEELCDLYHARWVKVGALARSIWEKRRGGSIRTVVP